MSSATETPTQEPQATTMQNGTMSASLQKVPVRLGMAPTSVEEGWRLAQMMARSELVPKNFRGKVDDILVAIQMGVEIGLPPMQALQSIAVINGRPSVWGDGFLALIMASDAYVDHDEYYEVEVERESKQVDPKDPDKVITVRVKAMERREGLVADDLKKDTTVAVCTFVRRGKATPVTRRFSVGQAKKASLLGKEGPWQTYPDRMLAMRARSWAGRDAFPDVLRGIQTAEEASDAPPDIDVTPGLPPPTEVRRISETAPPETTKAAPTPSAPKEVVVLDPATVSDVEAFLGGYSVKLSSGVTVDVLNEVDALELEKFKGTKNKVRITVEKVSDALSLKSFVIAD